jgi:hypothetical protein
MEERGQETDGVAVDQYETDDVVDLEQYTCEGHRPPRAPRYRIRIDRQYYIVAAPSLTARELLQLAGKTPSEQYMLSQKLRGGETKRIALDARVDFTTPGVERFMTLPLDQTEG